MTRHPAQFIQRWSNDEQLTLNPLRFSSIGTSVFTVTDVAFRTAFAMQSVQATAGVLSTNLGVQLLVCSLAVLLNLVLKPIAPAPMRKTIGAVLFCFSGPFVWLHVAGWSVFALAKAVSNDSWVFTFEERTMPTPIAALMCVGFAWLVAAIAGAHRIRLRKAFLVAFGLLALLSAPIAITGFAEGWRTAEMRSATPSQP